MPDISLCTIAKDCPLAEDCTRNPNLWPEKGEAQSYIEGRRTKDGCEDFRGE